MFGVSTRTIIITLVIAVLASVYVTPRVAKYLPVI